MAYFRTEAHQRSVVGEPPVPHLVGDLCFVSSANMGHMAENRDDSCRQRPEIVGVDRDQKRTED